MMLFVLFFLQFALAGTPIRIAVLEFRGIGIQESALTLLADDVREGVLVAVKPQQEQYLVMTRENMMSILNEMGRSIEDCSGECEVEIARNIGADYVISGEVYLIEEQYILSLKMHDTQKGNLLGREEAKGQKITELLEEATNSATTLVSTSLDIDVKNTVQNGSTNNKIQSQKTNDEMVSVSFDSNPSGASVYIDHQLLCNTTPCEKFVSKGAHHLKYVLQRYADHIESIEVQDDNTSFHISLQSHFGVYTVHSAPLGFVVYENGTVLGTTPFEAELIPGTHQLEIQDPCYQNSTTEVFAEEGERKDIYINLLEKRSGILVEAYVDDNPIRTDIFVDGIKVGKTGTQIDIPLCSQLVQIEHKNYRWNRDIEPVENKVLQLEANMQPKHQNKSMKKNQYNGKLFLYSLVVVYYAIVYLR